MKFELYQVGRQFGQLADSAKFYGLSSTYTQAEARQAFRAKKYILAATIEANTLQQVVAIANGDRANPLMVATNVLRNVGIGDIVFNHDTAFYHIRSQVGWDRIKI